MTLYYYYYFFFFWGGGGGGGGVCLFLKFFGGFVCVLEYYLLVLNIHPLIHTIFFVYLGEV